MPQSRFDQDHDSNITMISASMQVSMSLMSQLTFNITGVFDVPEEIIECSSQDPDPVMTMVVPHETAHTILDAVNNNNNM